MMKHMNFEKMVYISLFFAMMTAFPIQAASFSEFWKQDNNGEWYVEKPDGERVTGVWLCDDAVEENGKEVWYLIGKNGYMVTAPLVRDDKGSCYSIETEHNGHYGMLRNTSGTYGGISLSIEEKHEGDFAAIQNDEGIRALEEACGMTDVSEISSKKCVYTSTFCEMTGEREMADTGSGQTGGKVREEVPEMKKVKAREVDEELCAEYFIGYLNDYRRSLGLDPLETDDSQMSYAKERAYRDSVSHSGNTAQYEICSTHGVLPSEYEEISVEEAVAANAFQYFQASASHHSIMKLKTIRSVGAGFHIVEDKSSGFFNFYFCEANFEK